MGHSFSSIFLSKAPNLNVLLAGLPASGKTYFLLNSLLIGRDDEWMQLYQEQEEEGSKWQLVEDHVSVLGGGARFRLRAVFVWMGIILFLDAHLLDLFDDVGG